MPEGCSAAIKFTVVLEFAGLNDTEFDAFCRENGAATRVRLGKGMAYLIGLAKT
jgi:hypothetical protein